MWTKCCKIPNLVYRIASNTTTIIFKNSLHKKEDFRFWNVF